MASGEVAGILVERNDRGVSNCSGTTEPQSIHIYYSQRCEHHLLIERLAYFDMTKRLLGIMRTESHVRLLLLVGSCDSRLDASEAGKL